MSKKQTIGFVPETKENNIKAEIKTEQKEQPLSKGERLQQLSYDNIAARLEVLGVELKPKAKVNLRIQLFFTRIFCRFNVPNVIGPVLAWLIMMCITISYRYLLIPVALFLIIFKVFFN